jgi:hypothetical protein
MPLLPFSSQQVDISQAKLAVLIDADNTQPAIIEGLLDEVAKYGLPVLSGSMATGPVRTFVHGKTGFWNMLYSLFSNFPIRVARMPLIRQ